MSFNCHQTQRRNHKVSQVQNSYPPASCNFGHGPLAQQQMYDAPTFEGNSGHVTFQYGPEQANYSPSLFQPPSYAMGSGSQLAPPLPQERNNSFSVTPMPMLSSPLDPKTALFDASMPFNHSSPLVKALDQPHLRADHELERAKRLQANQQRSRKKRADAVQDLRDLVCPSDQSCEAEIFSKASEIIRQDRAGKAEMQRILEFAGAIEPGRQLTMEEIAATISRLLSQR